MQPLSTSAYVILGMLRLGARSGYEIKRTAELSTRGFWAISHAQIYPELARLEQGGLVAGRSEPRGRQQRRVYELTSAGEQALGQWLRRHEALTMELRDLGALKLFFADALEQDEARELVTTMRRRSERRIEQLQERSGGAAERLAADGKRFPLLTLRLGIAFHEALASACEQLEREIADEPAAAGR